MIMAIYGAKSIALGVYKSLQKLYPKLRIQCILVSSMEGNSPSVAGLPVWEIKEFTESLSEKEKREIHVLIAVPEDIHPEIVRTLERYGYDNYTCIDSRKEAVLMERYYMQTDDFNSLHSMPTGKGKPFLQVYMAKFYRDCPLRKGYKTANWMIPLQVGTDLTSTRVADITDNAGEHISWKNVNYCELTALYWIWKNRLGAGERTDYYGLFHYRRILDISEEDLFRIRPDDVDVILPFPTLHEPDISEHHARYMEEKDWRAMLLALEELQPAYSSAFPEILAQPYLYNYNILIAKADVLADYCAWLFPILKRTEELSIPKGWERADRYIGYLGENLMTLYFMYHHNDLKICHTGRLMLT